MLVEVSVDSLKSVGMADNDIISISSCLIICETHFAAESGVYCVVAPYRKVNSFVHSSESGAIAVV